MEALAWLALADVAHGEDDVRAAATSSRAASGVCRVSRR
jgi:hypothetical protein